MTTTKQPIESTPPTPINLSAATTAALSSVTGDGYSEQPKRWNAKRSYPFYKTCPGCGNHFPVANCAEYHKKKCCSRACAGKVSADRRRGIQRGPRKIPCKRMSLDQRKGKVITCPVCGTQVWKPDAWLRKVKTAYCSPSCRSKREHAARLRPYAGNGKGIKNPKKGSPGALNPAWKGGVTYFKKHGNYTGVKYVRCPVEYISMARKDGYVMEHRLLVAQAIGRLLLRSEVVHHKDHNPANNDLSNLQLFASNRDHKLYEHHGSPSPIWQL